MFGLGIIYLVVYIKIILLFFIFCLSQRRNQPDFTMKPVKSC